ncbi:MAG: ribosome-associated translation inhibitor RaiA [Candidatus Doudnabacteria bacterium]|nr:ribosome-associated translation inhibitor RaiA [Candidatus Doudnabacteria bacterium]
MNLNIKATNTTVSDSVRAGIENKLSVLEKFLKPDETVHVELEIDKHHQSGEVQRVEVRIQPHGHYAEAASDNFYAALDLVLPKIREQLTKEKDKKISLRRRLGAMFKRAK